MRRVLLTSVIVFMAWPAFAQEAPARQGPTLALSPTEIDLGTVEAADHVPHLVDVQNLGAGTLQITEIAPLCVCVDVDTRRLSIEPGATARFSILTMLADYPSNTVMGKVRLYTNDPAQPQVDILVHGHVTPEYVITPNNLDFGEVRAGQKAQRTLIVRASEGTENLKIKRIEASEGLIAALQAPRLTKERGKETKPLEPCSPYEIQVALAGALPPGPFGGIVTVLTNCKRVPRVEVKVNADIAGLAYSVTPKVRAFGTASPGDELGVFLVNGEGVRVVDVHADKPGLAFVVQPEDAGNGCHVIVDAATDAPSGPLLRLISLRLTDGTQTAEAQVRVFGRIK